VSEATKRPWLNKGNGCIHSAVGNAGLGACVADCNTHFSSPSEREANAELIVLAVNCHDELVRLAEYALSHDWPACGGWPNECSLCSGGDDCDTKIQEELLAILEKAKQK